MGLPVPLNKLFGILNEPGDEMHARIGKSGTKILKVKKNSGEKHAVVKYKNGRVVETHSYMDEP